MSGSPSDGGAFPLPTSTSPGPILHRLIRQGKSFSGRERNCCYLNSGGQFANVSSISGLDMADDARAIGRSDWDGDGDLDLWVANRSGPQIRFLRNDLPNIHGSLALRLEGNGLTTNRDAIGARVKVTLAEPGSESQVTLLRTLRAGDGFMSQSTKWLHFGLGDAETIEQVVVHWPGGTDEIFPNVKPNGRYRLRQGSAQAVPEFEKRPNSQQMTKGRPTKSAPPERLVSAAELPLPDLDYITSDGQRREIFANNSTSSATANEAKQLFVFLWSSTCPTCLKELDALSDRSDDLQGAGLEIVHLCVDAVSAMTSVSESPQGPTNYVNRDLRQFSLMGGMATEGSVEKLQLTLDHLLDLHAPLAVPTGLLLDRSTRIVTVYRGPVGPDTLLADAASARKLTNDSDAMRLFPGRWYNKQGRLSPLDLVWEMTDRGFLDDASRYIARHRQLLENHFRFPKLLVLVGNGHLARGDVQLAIGLYREALAIDVDYVDAKNNLAWLLATHSDEQVRDEQQAVALAEQAVAAAGNTPSLLDTLAAAYASAGRYQIAVDTAKKAIRIAKSQNQNQLVQKLERRIEIYKSQRPYRETSR